VILVYLPNQNPWYQKHSWFRDFSLSFTRVHFPIDEFKFLSLKYIYGSFSAEFSYSDFCKKQHNKKMSFTNSIQFCRIFFIISMLRFHDIAAAMVLEKQIHSRKYLDVHTVKILELFEQLTVKLWAVISTTCPRSQARNQRHDESRVRHLNRWTMPPLWLSLCSLNPNGCMDF
jgi:hypothetical protein